MHSKIQPLIQHLTQLRIVHSLYLLTVSGFFIGLALAYATGELVVDENGLLENIQLLFLLIAFPLSLMAFLKPINEQHRYLMLGFMLLTFAFILREMEFKASDAPIILKMISSPEGALYLTLAVFIPYIGYSLWTFSLALNASLRFARTYNVYRFGLAALLLLLGGAYDREWLRAENSVFLEEFFETLAWYIYLVAIYYMLPHKQVFNHSILDKSVPHQALN